VPVQSPARQVQPKMQQSARPFKPPVDELPVIDEVRQWIESNTIELFLQPS
jgi:hypothetical protein